MLQRRTKYRKEGMFQPQATPYAPFQSYGVATPGIHDFPGFQPSASSVVDSGGPTVFRNPIFSPTSNLHTGNFNNTTPTQYKMESDLEAQEALAREFQPSLVGPLVGEKKSSHAITEEYAKADPIYVAKTAALPQKYSHYRPILGDGNCGWRAVGFAYFETLLGQRQKSQFDAEVVRMVSLNNLLMKFGGFESWVYEDMVEETIGLLKDLSSLVETSPQDARAVLLERFNDPSISNSIVYHLRLLASSWLQKEPEKYEGFIADGNGVEGYRRNTLEPVSTEIEHLGMTLLIDVLLKPIGVHVEIVYLDRSEGSQVNTHLIQPVDQNNNPTNPGGPIMHLLYRPSHYDILYRDIVPSVQPTQPIPTDLHVQRAHAPTYVQQPHTPFMADMSILACFPGISLVPQRQQPLAPQRQQSLAPQRQHSFSSQYQSSTEQSYTPASMAPSVSPISPGGASSTTTVSSHSLPSYPPQQQQPAPLAQSGSMPSPVTNSPHIPSNTVTNPTFQAHLPILSHPTHLPLPHRASLPSEQSQLPSPSSTSSFRPSKYEWAAAADWTDAPIAFQTSTFKNSHYNTAHYNNPNFQPEEWTPEDEEGGGGRVVVEREPGGKRKKSS